MRKTLTLVSLLAVAACSTAQTAPVTTAITDISSATAQAQTALNTATNLYGMAKGMAIVAAAADPSLAPTINNGITQADAIVAKAPAVVGAAVTDIQTATALAATITAQANALTATAAPVVTVIPTAPAVASK